MLLAKDSDMKIDQRILALVDDSLIVRLNSQDAAVDVDDQNDFGSREGSLYVQGAEETRPASISFLRRFPVNRRFTSGDDHLENDCSFLDHGGNWPPHCVRGTKGVELVPGLKELPVKKYIKREAPERLPLTARYTMTLATVTDSTRFLRNKGQASLRVPSRL